MSIACATDRPMVRLDDMTVDPPRSVEFRDPLVVRSITSLAEVLPALHEADARAAAGEWVVFVLAYEAAPAFDPVMVTKPAPPTGTPLLWWASFTTREDAEPLPATPSRVIHRERSANRWPYPRAVEMIRGRIELGDVYQVNLTDRFRGEHHGDAFELYAGLVGVQSCAYGAYIDMGERVVASASPELFVRIDNGVVQCRPMKGTAPRLPRPDDDERAGAALARSDKDRAENVMIVDLLRNDISRLAAGASVTTRDLFHLERYETVWQLTSTIEARVGEPALADVLRALFPCGSITGAPKIAAMSIIDELENEPRGVYCGAIGVLAPSGRQPSLVCSVPIRTAVADPATRTFVYGAGGGITWLSDPHAEDDEVRHKARILTRSRRTFELFETLRIGPDGVRRGPEHLARLERSAHWFGYPIDLDAATALLAGTPRPASVSRLRLLLDCQGRLRVECAPLDHSPGPVRLAIDTIVTASDDPFSCHKTTERRHYDAARGRHPQADDVVLVNEHGHAIETTIANLAYRIGGSWFTPPLSDGGLAGIERAASVAEGRLVERSIAADELGRCDELAVINDLRGWRPATVPAGEDLLQGGPRGARDDGARRGGDDRAGSAGDARRVGGG